MDGPHLLKLMQKYDARLANGSIPALKSVLNRVATRGMRLGHCRWMCQEIASQLQAETDVTKNQAILEKGMRWLGFVQGVLWTEGYYTIDDMRDHSR